MKGIFLGTFNPPHIGHYSCLSSIVNCIKKDHDWLDIDNIHVIPCWQNPNKEKSISFNDRYNMCKLSFKEFEPYVFIDDIESIIKPKYTYDLIKYFKEGQDISKIGDNFWWIITVETMEEIISNNWYNSEWLLKNNKFVLLYLNNRPYSIEATRYHFENRLKIKNNLRFVSIEDKGIHSTDIRDNFWVNSKYDNCITQETKEYIINNNLYK